MTIDTEDGNVERRIARKEFVHRIDAVPAVGADVQIRTRAGAEYDARTVAGCDRSFRGIGGEVGYRIDGGFTISAEQVAFWRYR